MSEPAARLRLILGLKLKQLRSNRGWTLKEAARKAGLSFSYLSEIEKGKKYPTPEKLFELAEAYGTPFDDLVSLRLRGELKPLQDLLGSELLREFPVEMFGLKREDLLSLATDCPEKAGALVGALVDVGRRHDLQVEHFLLAALRSYQQKHANYFADLEGAASALRLSLGWSSDEPVDLERLKDHFATEYGTEIDAEELPGHPDLAGFRSVFLEGPPARLLINGRLLPSQQKFALARELGYRTLALKGYVPTSSWLRIESFEQLLSDFKASYFAGSLLMPEVETAEALQGLFEAEEWRPETVVSLRDRFDVTPEMLAYRITQLAPRHLGLAGLFLLRFARSRGGDCRLTEVLNLSRSPVPHGLDLGEHYCRRWPAIRQLASDRSTGAAVSLQRSRFVTEDAEFLVLSQTRSLSLRDDAESAVSVGFLVDPQLASRVGFLAHPAIPRVEVGLTCERCPLPKTACGDRVAPPRHADHQERLRQREKALADLGVF